MVFHLNLEQLGGFRDSGQYRAGNSKSQRKQIRAWETDEAKRGSGGDTES